MASACFLDHLQNLLGMVIWGDVGPDSLDDPFLINQGGHSSNAHNRLAPYLPLIPNATDIDDPFLFIGEQWEGQVELLYKLAVSTRFRSFSSSSWWQLLPLPGLEVNLRCHARTGGRHGD